VKRDHDRAARPFSEEPEISVGVVEGVRELKGCFNGPFLGGSGKVLTGPFSVQADEGGMIFTDRTGARSDRQEEMRFEPQQDATFTLKDVTIGLRFHWERRQDQTFQGELVLPAGGGKTLTAVNRIRLEAYLTSVISSEMSAEAPLEMLKAHAVASRSWLMCMLGRRGKAVDQGAERREATKITHGEADAVAAWQAAARAFHVRPVDAGLFPSATIPRNALQDGKSAIPSLSKARRDLEQGMPAFELFTETGLCSSRGEARRLIAQGGAYVNEVQIQAFDEKIDSNHIDANGEIRLRKGKKHHFIIRIK